MLKAYTYDSLGRLKKVSEDDKLKGDVKAVTAYSYDKVGNRISETKDGKTSTYSYNNLNELLEVKEGSSTVKEYTYDANGNTKKEKTSDAEVAYSYDISNQLTKYTKEAKNSYSKALTQKNEYNYTGRQVCDNGYL